MAKLQKKRIADLEEFKQILSQYWGYPEFRSLQDEIILSVGSGRDTLALMPTGGGKSITFQVPAMAMEGICLVITPLIALMKDQVDQLQSRKIKAAAIHSGMTRNEILTTLDNCIFGDYKFLYVSPERLSTDLFRARVSAMNVNLIAVDEAHCISQWGYDFRPSYLEIRSLREILEGIPVLALTATATPEVCEDIQDRLAFRKKNLLSKSFDRPNLAYVVRKTEDKTKELLSIVKSLDGSGIIYARNRKKCRELSQLLQENNIPADFYHAGLKQEQREKRQKGWIENQFRLMVATNAFGMGIDKPDVRFVIHVDLPDSPEAYFQEAGRAGRDGQTAWAVLLYSPADQRKVKERIDVNFPGIPRIREIYIALCNFLQIPHGSGKGQSYDFEMGEFLHRYKFNALIAHSALSALSREGYISITEAFNNPSRIMFIAGRDDLYNFQVKHADFDGFIKLLLRSYSGFFSQYVKIDEALLAKRSGLPIKKVLDFLQSLSKRKIIQYIPRKDIPVITFTEERLDVKNLLISAERYHVRKERYEKRAGEMLRYANSERICRNQFLLSYFGQLDSARCGKCDVCRKEPEMDAGSENFNKIKDHISRLLASKSMLLQNLVDTCIKQENSLEAEKVIWVIEWMIERGQVNREKDLTISLKESSL